MDLSLIRQEIDQIDAELVALLEQRMERVTQVAAYKQATGKAVLDTAREQQVLEKVASRVINKDYETAIVASFTDIMKHSRAYQAKRLSQDA